MKPRKTFRRGIALSLALLVGAMPGFAAEEARVFPVRAFFYDTGADAKLDPIFREKVSLLSVDALSQRAYVGLTNAFKGRVGPLTDQTASDTFAVSFHVTRAVSYAVNKGNGNSDVIASVTAGVYFTNVITGEILTTISRTVVSRAVVANSSDLNSEKSQLFGKSLDTLFVDLIREAAEQFRPVVVKTTLIDRAGELLVLDAGYRKGLQADDQIEGAGGDLLSVVYSAENYSVAKPVLASNLNLGAVFQKFLPSPASGKARPRVAVLIGARPEGFAKDYVARLFSEILGNTAPLTVVQVNTGFTQLLNAAKAQDDAKIDDLKSAGRRPPNYVIRLRVAEPLQYEAATNLDNEKIRRTETRAFADVVDVTGRIIYSVMGRDVINDSNTGGIGAGFGERRESGVKNALTDLAKNLSMIGEPKREYAEVVSSAAPAYQVNSQGKVYARGQQGMILRKAKAKFGNESRDILLPTVVASVDRFTGTSPTNVTNMGLLDRGYDKVGVGDIFEVQTMGTSPRSARAFAICGPSESLGNTTTTHLMELTGLAFGQKMPGMYYAPDIATLAQGIIDTSSGFSSQIKWDLPKVDVCIQPVERVTVGDEQCTDQCEVSIVSRYTMRVKIGEAITARVGFESQFKSTGYYKSIEPRHRNSLIAANVDDEAKSLLERIAEKVILPAGQ